MLQQLADLWLEGPPPLGLYGNPSSYTALPIVVVSCRNSDEEEEGGGGAADYQPNTDLMK